MASDFFAAFNPPFVSDASTDGTPLMAWLIRMVVMLTKWPLLFFSISAIANFVM